MNEICRKIVFKCFDLCYSQLIDNFLIFLFTKAVNFGFQAIKMVEQARINAKCTVSWNMHAIKDLNGGKSFLKDFLFQHSLKNGFPQMENIMSTIYRFAASGSVEKTISLCHLNGECNIVLFLKNYKLPVV